MAVFDFPSAKAYQTIIKLMRAEDLYDFWEAEERVGSIEWTLDAAKAIIKAWQHEFTKVMWLFYLFTQAENLIDKEN